MSTRKPARIALIVPSPIGGTLQYCHNFADALVDQGHNVLMATSIDYELKPFPRRYNVSEVFDRFTPRVGAIIKFAKTLRGLAPDIVHFQGAQRPEFYLILYLFLRSVTQAKFVWTPQDILSNSHKAYHIKLLRYLYSKMDHVFLNAEQNRIELLQVFDVPTEKTTVFPIPDLVAFARDALSYNRPPELQITDDQPLVLCFGLLEERKGITTLLEGFAQLATCDNAKLLIMGKPMMDISQLKAAIAHYRMEDKVQIIARYADFQEMNWLFERAHHLVMPYHNGWNSGVLASAFGFGKPVIATRVGGFDEVIQNGDTGLLVRPRDAKALTCAMSQMLKDKVLYKHLKRGARAEARKTSWANLAARTSGVYLTCLDGAKA